MRKRFAYLVTSVLANKKNVTSGPVLGVFTNEKAAQKHFTACVEHQIAMKGSLCWDVGPGTIEEPAYKELRRAYISHPDGSHTTLELQRWPVVR